MTDTNTDTPTRFTAKETQRIRNAFARMPYAATPSVWTLIERNLGSTLTREATDVSADQIVEVLDALTEVLRAAGERANRTDRELNEIRADLRAFRRVLGTDDTV